MMLKKLLKRIGITLLVVFVLLNIMAAFHAYKFTHFYSNIPAPLKPAEMGFTQKASAIFMGVKFPKSKVVDTFLVAHDTVGLVTSDGIKLESWYAKSDSIAKGTVIMFHGHGASKSGQIKEATAFHNMGWNVFLTDFRAHGNSEGEVCTVGVNESKDVKSAYDFIKSKGEKNIVLYGISLGASTILTTFNRFPIRPAKVILEMPFGTLLDGVEGRLKIMHIPLEPMGVLLTFWGGIEQGFWAFSHSPENYANNISCPVLLQWGINDPRVTERETNAIFKNLATRNKMMIKYARSGHQSLCKNENEKWMKCVSEFLDQ